MTERANNALRPGETLLRSPWFWFALFVLALNDHVLKGSGLAPAWLTGKLSDFSGLYVAPPLLAALLRVRSQRAWAACVLATGIVFAVLKLAPPCADAWSAVAAWLGLHFAVVSDATDLLALPVLVLAFRAGLRSRARRSPPSFGVSAAFAERFALVLGLPLCVATTATDDGGFGSGGFSSYGPHLHNPSRAALVLELRTLKPSVQLDCATIGDEPGALLPDSAFGPATLYRLEAHENLPMPESASIANSLCSAVIVGGQGLDPAILFWTRAESFPSVPATYESPDAYVTGAIIVERDADGMLLRYHSIGGEYVFEIEPPRLGSDGCGTVGTDQHVAIEPPISVGSYRIESADEGPDGCVALSLAPATESGTQQLAGDDADAGTADDGGAPATPTKPAPTARAAQRHYVCVPPGAFPFSAGQTLRASFRTNAAYVLRSASGPEELIVYRGTGGQISDSLSAMLQTDPRCDYQVELECPGVFRSSRVALSGATSATLRAGESTPWPASSGGGSSEVHVLSGGQRALFDQSCATDNASLFPNIELVVVTRKVGL